MPVDIEISLIAVHALANQVGHPAKGKNVAGPVESERVVDIEPLTGKNFVVDRGQPGIVGLKGVHFSQDGHLPDDIAGISRSAIA
jgi:hypothetical protein